MLPAFREQALINHPFSQFCGTDLRYGKQCVIVAFECADGKMPQIDADLLNPLIRIEYTTVMLQMFFMRLAIGLLVVVYPC